MSTFHPTTPIVSEETNGEFADAFTEVLEIVAGVKETSSLQAGGQSSSPSESSSFLKYLPAATAAIGLGAIALHAGGYLQFYQSIMEMKANVADPEDFWAAFNFWVFFAVGHPILQPILWISDVLHGSPGPKIADLVPATFLAGNAVAIGLIAKSKEVCRQLFQKSTASSC